MEKYVGRLFPVKIGQLITVAGRVSNTAEKIDIELSRVNNDGDDLGDIQFLLSARFFDIDNSIVRNFHLKGVGWGNEERAENLFPFNTSQNPLIKGGNFKISIFVDAEAFFVSIDEKPYCTFAHRHEITNIQKIKIAGDVDEVFQVNQRSAQPDPWPIANTNVFETHAPGQFNPGNVIVITGVPRGNPQGNFYVKFYDGVNKQKTHLTLMAFFECNQFAANSHRDDGCMGDAVVAESFPFGIQETFKLAIAITESEFLIAVNGSKILSMEFRDEIRRLLGSMTGIEVISNNGMSVGVRGVDYMFIRPECEGFERYT